MNTDPTQQPDHSHDQDTPDGDSPCLHCLLTAAFEKWIEAQPADGIDIAEAGYSIGQFFAETMGDIIHCGEHEQVHDFINHFHAAQHQTARRRAETEKVTAAEPVVQPNPNTKH